MSVLLRLVAHVPDAEAALAALRHAPSPVSYSDLAWSGGDQGLAAPFTLAHIHELISERREDLAGVILAHAHDPVLLSECMRTGLPAKLYRPLVVNPAASTRLLLEVARDSRVSVRRPALSALASRCRTQVRYADVAEALAAPVLDASDADLLGVCAETVDKAANQAALSTALSVAFERDSEVPDDVLEFLVGVVSGQSLDSAQPRLAAALCGSGRLDAVELLAIARRRAERRFSQLAPLSDAILARSDSLSLEERQEAARLLVSAWSRPDPRAVALLSTEDVCERIGETRSWALPALVDCPQLPSEVVLDVVTQELKSSPVPRPVNPLFSHPCVSGGLLDEAWSRACTLADISMLTVLARNPNLEKRHWKLLLERLDPRELVRHMGGFASCESFADAALELVLTAQRARYTAPAGAESEVTVCGVTLSIPVNGWEWALDRSVESLCENPAVTDESLAQLPAYILRGRWLTRPMLARIARIVHASLGTDTGAWQGFVTLHEDWEGSLQSLIDASRSL